jgi:nucleoside-diphosphate kinase
MTDRSLIFVKPDGVKRGLIGQIVSRIENKNLKIVAMKMLTVSDDLAKQHYAEHVGKPFFPGLMEFIQSGPVVAMVVEAPNVVAAMRNIMGATNPVEAAPGSIRADLAIDKGENLIHGSDSDESAQREIALWFPELS